MNCIERNHVKAIEYSVIGQNHIESGLENQDSILTEIISDDVGYMVLADGVSSAPNSKQGSVAATEVIKELCSEINRAEDQCLDLDQLKVRIVRNWKNRFVEQWNDYATTLNFIIFYKKTILIGQIGDGLIVLNVDGEKTVFTEETDFYSTETDALGEQVRKNAFRIEQLSYGGKFWAYMTTDGIGKEVAEESRIGLGEYLSKMLTNDVDEIKKELRAWIDELGNKNGDDKSIGFIRMET